MTIVQGRLLFFFLILSSYIIMKMFLSSWGPPWLKANCFTWLLCTSQLCWRCFHLNNLNWKLVVCFNAPPPPPPPPPHPPRPYKSRLIAERTFQIILFSVYQSNVFRLWVWWEYNSFSRFMWFDVLLLNISACLQSLALWIIVFYNSLLGFSLRVS